MHTAVQLTRFFTCTRLAENPKSACIFCPKSRETLQQAAYFLRSALPCSQVPLTQMLAQGTSG